MWALLTDMIQQVMALVLAGFVEGTGLPWPGSVIMATAGLTASDDWRAVLLLTVAFSTAYTLGSLLQYALGRALGPVALAWLRPQQRSKLEGLVNRFGVSAVCWARPLAIGNYVSIPAGMLNMNPIRFALYTFVGAIPWAAGTILAGRLLGERVIMLQDLVSCYLLPAAGMMALVAVTAFTLRLIRRRLEHRRAMTETL